MRTTILQAAAVGLCACIAGVGGCGAPESGADETTVGQDQQAVYADDAYGFDGNQDRCWTPSGWADGKCKAPKKKTWRVRIPTISSNRGCGIDTIGAIETAVAEWEWQLNVRAGHGWNVSHTTGSNADFAINCDIGYSQGLARTTPSNYTCDGNTPWRFCRFATVDEIRVWPNMICPPLSCTLTSTQVRTETTNVVLHELMHVAGLGHDTCAETPLMAAAYCGGTQFIQSPTDFEIWMLQRYNPGSGTSPM